MLWSPIITAPKDGTDVLVYYLGDRVTIARWDNINKLWHPHDVAKHGVRACKKMPPLLWMRIPDLPHEIAVKWHQQAGEK